MQRHECINQMCLVIAQCQGQEASTVGGMTLLVISELWLWGSGHRERRWGRTTVTS